MNNKIKVAFFGEDFSRRGKGTALVIQKIAEQFADNFSDKIELIIASKRGKCESGVCQKARYIEIKTLKLPFFSTFFSYLAFFFFNKEKFDIAVFNRRIYPGFNFLKAKKIVLISHNVPVSPAYEEKISFANRIFDFFIRWIGKYRIDAVIGDSNDAAEGIRKYYGIKKEKVYSIYCGVGDEFGVLSDKEKERAKIKLKEKYGIQPPYILDVSRLDPHKNVAALIEAFSIVAKKGFPHKLVIVGGKHIESYYEVVMDKIKKLGLTEKVFFADYIEAEDLPAVYNLADVFVFPSLMEGFGLPVLEAMKSGAPVITSNVCSMPEVAGEAGILINPKRVEDIARGITKILSDSGFKKELIQKGIKRAEEFSWRKSAGEYIKLYENILRG
ncbi:MAG: glycosyltransferase family 1 protein [Candidatus Pacebacteria bacterium]|nr:glycosyltransferase family 1 protein [Candidatus Paceibacterota bacterium]